MTKQLIFLGAPGSGKGTQALRLVKDKGYKHLSTGDLLRSEVAKGSDLGLKAKAVMDKGELVSDELVIDLIRAQFTSEKIAFIFDGFPRTVDQAKALDSKVLAGASYKVVYFKIDLKELRDRLVNRRTCGGCGEIYNLKFNPPKRPGICDKCGVENLVHREDDLAETVDNRLNVFTRTIEPVIDFYNGKGALYTIDAGRVAEKVYAELENILV